MIWYEKEGTTFSPVVSTRVRFARNLENTPFPHKLSPEGKREVLGQVRRAFEGIGSVHPVSDMTPAEKESYVASRLASPALMKGQGGALILPAGGEGSVMVCEEDHIRLQTLFPGKAVSEALSAARRLLAPCEKLPLARREGLGYLTACPTNLGSACRISVMIHLPALHALGALPHLAEGLSQSHFTLRGAYGEGSGSVGGLVQISNQARGALEPEALGGALEEILLEVEEKERQAARTLYQRDPLALEDAVCRAVGTLSYAKKITYDEFCSLYLTVRFGKALGIDEARRAPLTDRLLVELDRAPMVLSDATLSDPKARDEARARRLSLLFRR